MQGGQEVLFKAAEIARQKKCVKLSAAEVQS